MKKFTNNLNNHLHNLAIKGNNYDFRVVDYKKLCNYNGTSLPQHEVTHKKVQEVISGRVFAIMSSYKNKDNKFLSVKVSDIKMNGSFFPKKNPTNKKIIFDSSGNQIPDPDKGGQHLLGLENPRIVIDSDIIVDRSATAYCNAHKGIISSFYEKCREKYPYDIARVPVEDSSLYHENGSPIFDTNGNEIEY